MCGWRVKSWGRCVESPDRTLAYFLAESKDIHHESWSIDVVFACEMQVIRLLAVLFLSVSHAEFKLIIEAHFKNRAFARRSDRLCPEASLC